MKILPDYLIQIMPAVESAIEELRLSVIDHAYDLLKCLDIDELSYEDIREKLKLYNLTVENMTEEWLPNGKFYKLYPYIRHHRTRKNTISSIVRSGGQFEELWNYDFSEKDVSAYRTIQLVRHYELGTNADGYFLVSGDIDKTPDGRVLSSALTALSSDILLSQALPAGYTYLYIPWPRPTYPGDCGYFYNVHMLMFDRLVYAKDCKHQWISLWYLGNEYRYVYYCQENHGTNQYYNAELQKYGSDKDSCTEDFDSDLDECKEDVEFFELEDYTVPASTKYDWQEGTNTPFRTPYWFDYHFMEEMRFNKRKDGYWPITEKSWYYIPNTDDPDSDNKYIQVEDPRKATFCFPYDIYDQEDTVGRKLVNPDSVFPTPCYLRTRIRSSAPNRSQEFTPYSKKAWIILESYNSTRENEILAKLEELFNLSSYEAREFLNSIPKKLPLTKDYSIIEIKEALSDVGCVTRVNSIDENCFVEPGYAYTIKPGGSYRFDFLAQDYVHTDKYRLGHVKTYRPVWIESSPIFDMMQSDYKSDGVNDIASHSLKYWSELKQSSNIIKPTESTIKDNKPAVSAITHTSYDRPTAGHEIIDVGYTIPLTRGNNQGEVNKQLSVNDITDNEIYYYDFTAPISYNPDLYYTLVTLCAKDQSENTDIVYDAYDSSCSVYLEGDPYAKKLYVNLNSDSTRADNDYSYVTYRTSKLHQLWFSQNKDNVTLFNDAPNPLYNSKGSHDLYYYSFNGIGFHYYIKGVFDENQRRVDYGNAYLKCILVNNEYDLSLYNVPENTTAAYVLFAVESFQGAVDDNTNWNINRAIYVNNAVVSAFNININRITWDGSGDPEIIGGNYNTVVFPVENQITGGNYDTAVFPVENQITGGNYDTDNFDVILQFPNPQVSLQTFTLSSEENVAPTDGFLISTVLDFESNTYSINTISYDLSIKSTSDEWDAFVSGRNTVFDNLSSRTIPVYTVKVYSTERSHYVSNIIVYNSNNEKVSAFKYEDVLEDYYYVLDETQTSWTNDLASIGYSLTPSVVLPEVVLLGNAEYDYWLYVGATTANITLSSGNNCPLYSDRGSSSYGWTTYPKAVISCQKYEYSEYWNVAKGRTGLSLVMSTLSGVQWPGCQNDLNESITFIRLKAAYCKNDSATVVTVYNSSNVAYNAFKYTANNTDYYYVLDGTQTDWTDDLASIGYHLISVAYLGAGDVTVRYNTWFWLYLDPNGSQSVPFDANTSYTFDSAYLDNGTQANANASATFMGRPSSSYTSLALRNIASGFTAHKILYHAVK